MTIQVEPMVLSFPLEFINICGKIRPDETQKFVAKDGNGLTLHIGLRKYAERIQYILSTSEIIRDTSPDSAIAFNILSLDPYTNQNDKFISGSSADTNNTLNYDTSPQNRDASLTKQENDASKEKVVHSSRCKPKFRRTITKSNQAYCEKSLRSKRRHYAEINQGTSSDINISETERQNIRISYNSGQEACVEPNVLDRTDENKQDDEVNTDRGDIKTSNKLDTMHEKQDNSEDGNGSDDLELGSACIKCEKHFPTVQDMEKHVKHSHKDDIDFPQLIQQIEGARDGRRKRQSPVSVTCPLCGHERHGVRILRHMQQAHSHDPRYEQCLINVKAEHRAKRLKHRRQVAQNDAKMRQPCHFCGKLYARTCIRQHIKYQCRSNPERQPMKHCTQCGFRTIYPHVLEKHVAEKHPQNYKVVCELCGHTTRSKSVMFSHRRKVHNVKGKNSKECLCRICGKECCTAWELQSHMTCHSDVRPVNCSECSKDFKTQANLKKHIKATHHNIFPYHCQSCGHGVAQKSGLQSHRCDRVRRGQQGTANTSTVPQSTTLATVADNSDPMQVIQLGTESASSDTTYEIPSDITTNSFQDAFYSNLPSEQMHEVVMPERIQGEYQGFKSTDVASDTFVTCEILDGSNNAGVEEIQYDLEEVADGSNSEMVYFQVEGNRDAVFADDGTELVFVYEDAGVEIA